jgi:hypothetical protein
MTRPGWSYSTGFPADRLAYLRQPLAFEEIGTRLAASARVIGATVKPCRERPFHRTHRQPIFRLAIPTILYDLFYNGPDGYRARYHLSPEDGLAANHWLIGTLSPLLRRHTAAIGGFPRTETGEMRPDEIEASLVLPSAKVWVCEVENGPGLATAEHTVIAERWEKTAADQTTNYWPQVVMGRRAPTGTVIEVKGALIDQSGTELVPAGKMDRAFQIHVCGYT